MNMKRIISVFLLVVTLALLLAGCARNQKNPEDTDPVSEESTTSQGTPGNTEPGGEEDDFTWIKQPDRFDEPVVRDVTYVTPYADGKMIYYENFDSIENFDSLSWKKLAGTRIWTVMDGKLVAAASWNVKEQWLKRTNHWTTIYQF